MPGGEQPLDAVKTQATLDILILHQPELRRAALRVFLFIPRLILLCLMPGAILVALGSVAWGLLR